MNLFTRQKQTHKHRKTNLGLPKGKGEEEGQIKRMVSTDRYYNI